MTAFAELDLAARTDALEKAVLEIRKIGAEGDKTESKVKRSTDAMNAGFSRLAGAAGTVAGALLSMQTVMASVTAARQFDAALAETSTLLAGNADQMRIVEAGARSLAREFGGNATSQVQAYYQAISAGAGDAAAATKLLDSANRLAKGGVTDVTTAVDVLTTATNAYKASGLTAADASDALFIGMKAGKTTITELSAAVGGVLPLAVSLGVSFDETVAAMSALTTQGIGTAQAATGVRAALTSMIAPSDEAADLAAQLGIEFSAAGVQARGFGGVMDQIMAKTNGNTAQIQQLFGSVEATTAALSFAGGAGTVYGTIMDQMAAKAGATSEAFDIVASSLNERLNVVLAQGTDLLLGFGQSLLTVMVPALEAGISLLQVSSGALETFGVVVAGLAATQIPWLISILGAKAAALLAGASAAGIATVAMTALNTAITFMGGPIGLVIGAIGALGAAMYLTTGKAKNLGGASSEMNAVLRNVPQHASAASSGIAGVGNASSTAAPKVDAFASSVKTAADNLRDLRAAEAVAASIGPITPGLITDYLGGLDGLDGSSTGTSSAPGSGGGGSGGGRSGGGGSGGGGGDDGFQAKLDALTEQFQTEQELIDEWYKESQAVLADRRAMEQLGAQGHADALLKIEEELQRRKAELRDQDLSHYESFFGAMAGALQSGGGKMLAISKGFALAEAAVSIWRGAAKALELPFPASLSAWGQVIATGAKALSGIKSASFGSAGASGGGSGGSRSAAAEPAQQQRIVRLDVQGEGMFADMLRQSGQAIVDAITNEQKFGGTTILMGRA